MLENHVPMFVAVKSSGKSSQCFIKIGHIIRSDLKDTNQFSVFFLDKGSISNLLRKSFVPPISLLQYINLKI